MRRLALTTCTLVVLGSTGWACDNDATTLPTGATGTGGGGGDTTSTNVSNGGNGASGGAIGGNGAQGGGGNGGDGGAGGQAMITTCVEDLAPQEIGDSVLISEISVGNYVELYNNTNAAVDVSVATTKWCVRPNYGDIAEPGVVIEPGGYRTIAWPGTAVGTAASGELALYLTAPYGTAANMLDYVCWGTPPAQTRKAVAEDAGSGPQWAAAAPCADALANGTIKRLNGNSGDAAASWDSTVMPDPTNCEQP